MIEQDVDVLFHYCSVETFMSIMKNKTIRLSDVNKSNDYLENKAILDMLKEAAIDIYKKSPIRDSDVLIYGMKNQDAFKYIIDIVLKKILEFNDVLVYCACFSEENDLLSQWRGYADNGNGIAIGFNLDCLKEICKTTNLLKIGKVIYTNSEYARDTTTISKYAKMIVDDIFRALSNENTDALLTNSFGSDYFSLLTRQCLIRDTILIKNESFSEEKEWRIILDDELSRTDDNWDELYNWNEDEILSDNEKLFPKALQFRSTGNDIISYLDLCFEPFVEKIISHIVIGPNCNVKESDLNQFLCHFGFQINEINITKSKSSYREK